MWQITPEEWEQWKHRSKDVGYGILFVTALVFFGLTAATGNLGFAGTGFALLAVVGIGKA